MRLTRLLLFFLSFSLIIFVSTSHAEENGYEKVVPPQPTQHADKIEVIEFFWYGCPHCYALEPEMVKWLKTKPANVEFIRQPAVFSKVWGDHAKAYFTTEALGVTEKIHADFFDAIQNKKQNLQTEDELAKFFSAHGVDEKAFHDAYNSFLVDAKMRQANEMGGRYGITGVPTLIINGKFKTNGTLAKSHTNMISVMNQLIKQETK
jgi:protein dithiol oxidoreductase (disulfide-forming)